MQLTWWEISLARQPVFWALPNTGWPARLMGNWVRIWLVCEKQRHKLFRGLVLFGILVDNLRTKAVNIDLTVIL